MTIRSQTNAPVVLVISPDWTLRAMVRAELREADIEALGMEGTIGVEQGLVAPSLIVVDGVELRNAAAWQVLKDLVGTVPILVVDSRTDPAPDLPGAEVLWRPLRVEDIASRVLARLGRDPG
jgi:hypothetical protein